jgi:nitrite reductase/ring-hydroxylating ferredoxin subunit
MHVGCSRRRFVKTFAAFTAMAFSRHARWVGSVLAEVQPAVPPDTGLLRLRLSDFPVLQKEFGSIRLGTSPIDTDHHPVGLFYPVLIKRAANNQFYALDTACSHEGCTVPTFDPAARCMQCPCHGSQYYIDGTVRRGPANFPLRSFTVHYDGSDSLAVELPDVSFALQAVDVQPVGGRLHLQFIAFDQLEYEIHFRASATSDWTGPLPFSLTPTGAADQLSVMGHADYADVYVDRSGPTGFYAVAIRSASV